MPTKERRDGISTQLTAALAFRADISLRCYNELSETTFKCDCTHSPSTDYSHHCSSFWIALQAISSQPHIKLKSLILSSSVNDTNAETRLPEIRSLITDKLANLQNLVLCYTHATEYEDLRAFLSCCQTLRRLCLRVRTFKALDEFIFHPCDTWEWVSNGWMSLLCASWIDIQILKEFIFHILVGIRHVMAVQTTV